jgi:hypothetical protein
VVKGYSAVYIKGSGIEFKNDARVYFAMLTQYLKPDLMTVIIESKQTVQFMTGDVMVLKHDVNLKFEDALEFEVQFDTIVYNTVTKFTIPDLRVSHRKGVTIHLIDPVDIEYLAQTPMVVNNSELNYKNAMRMNYVPGTKLAVQQDCELKFLSEALIIFNELS